MEAKVDELYGISIDDELSHLLMVGKCGLCS